MRIQRINTLHPSFDIERSLLDKGYKVIAGVDEAGRGALAGPLAVGFVIYKDSFIKNPPPKILNNINDSKRLSPIKRGEALTIIEEYSELAITGLVSHRIIDKININRATEYAIKRLIQRTPLLPDIILLDGNFSFDVGIPIVSLVKGDTISTSISSASIVAKVKRDSIIEKFDLIYPGYGLKKNKGYGTKDHREAIIKIGPSPIHRKSYQPVRELISKEVR